MQSLPQTGAAFSALWNAESARPPKNVGLWKPTNVRVFQRLRFSSAFETRRHAASSPAKTIVVSRELRSVGRVLYPPSVAAEVLTTFAHALLKPTRNSATFTAQNADNFRNLMRVNRHDWWTAGDAQTQKHAEAALPDRTISAAALPKPTRSSAAETQRIVELSTARIIVVTHEPLSAGLAQAQKHVAGAQRP